MKKRIYISLLGAVLVLPTWAQDPPVSNTLNQEIIAVGERELKLKDAFKSTFYPQEIDTVITKDDLQYDVLPVFFKTNFEPDTIKAARLKVVEPLSKLYPGYVKLGIGNYTAPLAEVYLGSKRERNGLYAVKLRHFSSKGDTDNPAEFTGPFSNNELDVWGKKLFRKTSLDGHLYGSRQVRTFNDSIYTGPEIAGALPSDQRIFSQAGLAVDFQSYYKDEDKVNHHETLDVGFWGDNRSAQEIHIHANSRLEKYNNTELYKLDVGVQQNLYSLSDSAFTQNNTVINLVPHIATNTGKWLFDVGLNVTTFLDRGRNYFYFFPEAKITYMGLKRFAVPYAGLNGGAHLNTFQRLAQMNPFLNDITQLRLQREKLNVFLGLRGSFSERSSYNFKAGYHQRINAPIFILTADSVNRLGAFNLDYVNYNYFHILGEYSLEIGSKVEAGIQANYFNYDADTLGLNLPEILVEAHFKYNINDKFIAELGVTAVPQRLDVLTESNGLQNLEAYTDINIGFEYRYTRRFSVYLNGANILGSYLQFPNYAALGTFISGGLTYSF